MGGLIRRWRHRRCLARIAALERWDELHDAWVLEGADRPTAVARADAGEEPRRQLFAPSRHTNYVQVLSAQGLAHSALRHKIELENAMYFKKIDWLLDDA